MMTRADSPSAPRPERDRRRATRVQPGPLRVRLHRTCEGILVDISETGALVQVPSSVAPDKPVTVSLESADALLRLPGRVVRSMPHQVELASATLARKYYKIAVEFSDLPEEQVEALRKLLKNE
jgi:glucose-6-phosphate dehydrogenase assembly protein OpcA